MVRIGENPFGICCKRCMLQAYAAKLSHVILSVTVSTILAHKKSSESTRKFLLSILNVCRKVGKFCSDLTQLKINIKK